jgi:hypothetical protein
MFWDVPWWAWAVFGAVVGIALAIGFFAVFT